MFLLSAALALTMQTAPAPSDVIILQISRRCVLRAEGEKFNLNELRGRLDQWERDARMLTLNPDPHAQVECVDAVLKVIRDARFSRLGFIVNEQVRDEAK